MPSFACVLAVLAVACWPTLASHAVVGRSNEYGRMAASEAGLPGIHERSLGDSFELPPVLPPALTVDAFPVQQLKANSANIERVFLAKKKAESDWHNEKWYKKVLKVKVLRDADNIMEKREKKLDNDNEDKARLAAIRSKEDGAKVAATENRQRAQDQEQKTAYATERQKKASFALHQAVKQVTKLKDGEGDLASADRQQSSSMLAKLRVASAHADKNIVGLTPAQKEMLPMRALHAALELATGDPNDVNLHFLSRQFKETTADVAKENKEKIKDMNNKHEHDQKAFLKKLNDAHLMEKQARETKAKKEAIMEGKKEEYRETRLKIPAYRSNEEHQKRVGSELRHEFVDHQNRITYEIDQKGQVELQRMKSHETAYKKAKQSGEALVDNQCENLQKTRVKVMEARNKKVAAFSAARKNLLSSQGAANGTPPYDPSKEAAVYVDKGKKCESRREFLVTAMVVPDLDLCKLACTEKGAYCGGINYPVDKDPLNCELLKPGAVQAPSPQCVENAQTGACEVPGRSANCNIYDKISGPGSSSLPPASLGEISLVQVPVQDESEASLVDLGSGLLSPTTPAISQTPEPDLGLELALSDAAIPDGHQGASRKMLFFKSIFGKSPSPPNPMIAVENGVKVERANKVRAEAAKAAEGTQKRVERETKTQAELMSKRRAELAAKEKIRETAEKASRRFEASNKAKLKIEHMAAKKELNKKVAEAERKSSNAEGEMQEANVKAADADVQSRHCEGEKDRRRRTCACDDPKGGGRRLLSEPNPIPVGEISEASEIANKKLLNWERRRYVRRRFVEPSSADRRRRYIYPSPPPPPRIPGEICPCCTPLRSGLENPNPTCVAERERQIANVKAGQTHRVNGKEMSDLK